MDESKRFHYKAKILRWIDGDTVELLVDLGFKTFVHERFRLYGIDTPELRPARADFVDESARQAHITRAKAATRYCESMCPPDTFVMVETHLDKKGKYGRYLCTIHIGDTTLNQILIEEGHAEPY